MKLLHIDSSVMGDNSVSRQLTARIVAEWQKSQPGVTTEYLDLALAAPSHLSLDSLGFRLGADAATEVQRTENALSEALVSQFLAADVVVIGAPTNVDLRYTVVSAYNARYRPVVVKDCTEASTEEFYAETLQDLFFCRRMTLEQFREFISEASEA